jgi:4-amino-4-deoxy-L-arabinose transferase-like glycosyltransferase
MHDWNGAFFSQLARNLLRYPISVHHGMGVVAVGEAVPPAEERSLYAAHPPALIWLVALAFRLLGEAEWVARLVPILASLGSLALLIWLVKQSLGSETAMLAGLVYAVSPMTVFFGRMVDHEAVCLFLMLAALACWRVATADLVLTKPQAVAARIGWVAAIAGGIWVDWCGVLFAGLFSIHALLQFKRGRVRGGLASTAVGVSLLATLGMLAHLVYGGLEGRFSDLMAIFVSRAANPNVEAVHKGFLAPEGPWRHIVGNLTWPTMLFAGVGLVRAVFLILGRSTPAPRHGDESGRSQAIEGWWVLLATGVLWLCVLWRQFERHNYWTFYLGPPTAVWAAEALLAVRNRLSPMGRRSASGVYYAAVALVVAAALRGTDGYFTIVSYPGEAVSAWRQINAATGPNDRVLFYLDPVLPEQRGQYLLRNLVPTQQTYYLDRPFGVEKNLAAVIEKASDYSVYVLPVSVALSRSEHVSALESRFPCKVLGMGEAGSGYAVEVFDLRRGDHRQP